MLPNHIYASAKEWLARANFQEVDAKTISIWTLIGGQNCH